MTTETTTTDNVRSSGTAHSAGREQGQIDMTAHEALIKDLARIYGADNSNNDALEKAKEKHQKNSDASIRDLAQRLSAVNAPMDSATVEAVADSVAQKLSKGNKNVHKARKSEIKLCLDQRTHIAEAIREIDNASKDRGDDDKKINLRAAVLGSLRVTKKDGCSASDAVHQWLGKFDYVKSDAEKMQDIIGRLEGSDLLMTGEGTARQLHPVASVMLDALSQAIGGDLSALDNFQVPGEPGEPEEPEDAAQALLEENNLVFDDAGDDEVDAPDELDESIDIVEIPEPEPEDDSDIESILNDMTRGLL